MLSFAKIHSNVSIACLQSMFADGWTMVKMMERLYENSNSETARQKNYTRQLWCVLQIISAVGHCEVCCHLRTAEQHIKTVV